MPRVRAHRAFSLVELVIVVVIIAILGSIAVPRLSGIGRNASEVALRQNLAILTRAVERYKAEHMGTPPTSAAQLLQYTDEDGNTKTSSGYPFVFGPYISKMPGLPLGSNRGKTEIASGGSPGDTATAGWWIDDKTGDVRANAPDEDLTASGEKLNEVVASSFLKR